MKLQIPKINVIGAGMAGSETAWILGKHGIEVHLYEMKPKKFSAAHKLEGFAELVCSNSLGSFLENSAPQMLKSEMAEFDSIILQSAWEASVPSGNALGVDREKMSAAVTARLESLPNVHIVRDEFTTIQADEITVIATGPLTSDALARDLLQYIGADTLYFYDSISPIVDADSIDYSKTFFANRYDEGRDDYVNCPMTKEQYYFFVENILAAEKVPVREFEEMKCFESCMPIEVLAERGPKTLSFGPMKPVGLTDPKTGRWPYAVVQLRRENDPTTMYNLVGFQTRMKWGEQKRIFSMIPGLEKAEFIRMGSLHRNTYIDAPTLLNSELFLRQNPNIAIAGQLSGVEGYVESAAMGILVGLTILHRVLGVRYEVPPITTALGALLGYITNPRPNGKFSPMNINFGLLPPWPSERRIDKKEKKTLMVQRARQDFLTWKKDVQTKLSIQSFRSSDKGIDPSDDEHQNTIPIVTEI